MLVDKILAFLKGSVTVEAEGAFTERFLNICMRRGIFLSDVKRLSDEKINMKMGIKGFRSIRPIAKKTRTKVKIKNRSGLPFFLHRYKKRRLAAVGVLVFFAVLWYLTTHIMGIDIVGNERLSVKEIEKGLKEFGLYRGVAVHSLDRKLIQNKMMTAFDDIAWIGVNIRGSRAYIEVKERLDTAVSVDKDIPCNIVAKRSGIIKTINIKAGQTVVKINDMVEEGDLLVSGAVDSSVLGIRYEHSDGEVYAETIYKKTKEYPLEFTEKVYTGNEKKRYSVTVFGKKLNLCLNRKKPFEYSEDDEKEYEYTVFGKEFLTLKIGEKSYKEYTPQKRRRSELQAADLGKKELETLLERELSGGVEILNRSATFKKTDKNEVEVTVKFICSEDIARQSPIDKM